MVARKQRILIASHSPDMADLLRTLLREAGYDTISAPLDEGVKDTIREYAPDAVVMEVVEDHPFDLYLLDHLRTDPKTMGLPVVAMASMPATLESVITSFNVKQTLVLPFDLEELEQKVQDAIQQTPIIGLAKTPLEPPNPLFVELASRLAARSRQLIIRWVQRLATMEPFRRLRLNLVDEIDHVPVLVEAVLLALQTRDYRQELEGLPAIKDRVAAHALTRIRQGVPLALAVKEYEIMREEIRHEIGEALANKHPTPDEMMEIIARKDYALDMILGITVEIYVQQK